MITVFAKKLKQQQQAPLQWEEKRQQYLQKKQEQTPPLWEENGNVFAKTLFACIDACQRGQNIKT